MAANADQEIIDRREQLLDEELDKFVNGINTSKYKPKSNTWMSIWFESTPIEIWGIIYTIYRSASEYLRILKTIAH